MKWLYWIVVLIVCSILIDSGGVAEFFGWFLLLGAIILYMLAKLGKSIEAKAGKEPTARAEITPKSSVKRSPPKSSVPEHRPPPPTGSPAEPWSPRTRQFEVAGEYFLMSNLARVFQGINLTGDDGAELRLPATLVPDPKNPYDRNAVAVFVSGHHVGYLERDDASVYHLPIAEMSGTQAVTVHSRQWARRRRGEMFARVTVSLPEPDGFSPANVIPTDSLVLPIGSTIQVTREDQFMGVLTPLLRSDGGQVNLAATLHAIIDIRARSAAEIVEVRLDGEPVGVLTVTQSANLLPLVKFFEERNLTPVARATLKGNRIKADMTLYVAKAQDVDPAWLDSFGPALGPKPSVIRPAFEWDD